MTSVFKKQTKKACPKLRFCPATFQKTILLPHIHSPVEFLLDADSSPLCSTACITYPRNSTSLLILKWLSHQHIEILPDNPNSPPVFTPKIERDYVGNAGKPWSWLVGMKSHILCHHYISIPGELEAYQIEEEMGFWKRSGQLSVKSLGHVLNPESWHPSHFRISPFLLILHLMISLRDIHKSHLSITFKKIFHFLSNIFQLSWSVLQNVFKLYGLKHSRNKWSLM